MLNTFYTDADADGFGDATAPVQACDLPLGAADNDADCDDAVASTNPAATEVCDGIDNNCDAAIDDADPNVDLSNGLTSYADADADGFGDALASSLTCEVPSGNVLNADDCDDTSATTNPAATEVCDGVDNDCDAGVDEDVLSTFYADADADGFGDAASTLQACELPTGAVANADDCDDTQDAINPAAPEVCDGLDNDCDTAIDDADPGVDLSTGSTWFADADADGFGDSATAVAACDAPSGYLGDDSDCDDANDAINPGALEQCDGIDNDCDALVDLNDDDVDGIVAYTDADGDGYGTGDGTTVCELGDGQAALDGDCDDADGYANPGAIPRCFGSFDSYADEDRDCDGERDYFQNDTNTYYVDYDNDGFGGPFFGAITDVCRHDDRYGCEDIRSFVTPDELREFFPECNLTQNDDDCDDFAATTFPGAQEVCDGEDNDCDGLTDDADDSLNAGSRDFFVDGDGDGFGAGDGVLALTCSPGDGFSAVDTDCDDAFDTIYPGAPDLPYDGIDSDCDGSDDFDLDGDGYVGVDGGGTDCDDLNPNIRPDATERCDGIDNNCSGLVDDQDPLVDPSTYYADFDGDGFGDLDNSITAASCLPPEDYTLDTRDCDDTTATRNPAAPEVCDGIDNDCDGLADLDDDDVDALTVYVDADRDRWGTGPAISVCELTDGFTLRDGDCDDTDQFTNPGAPPRCINASRRDDRNCNGIRDDEDDTARGSRFYLDVDRDRYGDSSYSVNNICELEARFDCESLRATTDLDSFPLDASWCVAVAVTGDCDDDSAAFYPGATEVCDWLDNDCDGLVDDADDSLDAGSRDFYVDGDGDGFGAGDGVLAFTCSPGDGFSAVDTDCDDAFDTIYPGAPDTPYDGIDSDCDGSDDFDLDGDGYAGVDGGGTDCDDLNPNIRPDATERCDGIDNNCSGLVDDQDPLVDQATYPSTYYADSDGDGFGDPNITITGASCLPPEDYTLDTGDCDDSDPTIYTGAPDAWYDGVDSDCAGNDDYDQDGDGYASVDGGGTDCEDQLAHAFPGAPEQCDGLDTDCDPATSEWLVASVRRGDTWTVVSETDTRGVRTGNLNLGEDNLPSPLILQERSVLNLCTDDDRLATFNGTINAWGNRTIIQRIGSGRVAIVPPSGTGGPVLHSSAITTLRDIELVGGEAVEGGTVFVQGGQLTAERVVIRGGRATGEGKGRGGGLYAVSARVEFVDSELHNNSAQRNGGAIAAYLGSQIILNNTVVSNNSAATTNDSYTLYDGGGGGIYARDSSVYLRNGSIVSSNLSTHRPGGGIVLVFSTVTCEDSAITENGARQSDGLFSTRDQGGISMYFASSEFNADNCDLGTDATMDNNFGFDVETENGVQYDFGNNVTATCDSAGCTTP